jgi:hypothetical protein
MNSLQSEKKIRAKVREIRKFYFQLTLYGIINVACIMAWAVSGGRHFWPFWLIIIWGAALVIQAVSLGIVPALNDLLPFMSPEWEEAQAQKIMERLKTGKSLQAKIPSPRMESIKTGQSLQAKISSPRMKPIKTGKSLQAKISSPRKAKAGKK